MQVISSTGHRRAQVPIGYIPVRNAVIVCKKSTVQRENSFVIGEVNSLFAGRINRQKSFQTGKRCRQLLHVVPITMNVALVHGGKVVGPCAIVLTLRGWRAFLGASVDVRASDMSADKARIRI